MIPINTPATQQIVLNYIQPTPIPNPEPPANTAVIEFSLQKNITSGCYCVAWNGSKWVAGGQGTNTIATSQDGINWAATSNIFGAVRCVAWNGSIWVAGGNGTGQIATSQDGITWAASTSGNSVITYACQGVASKVSNYPPY
jgi:hypothetical protein